MRIMRDQVIAHRLGGSWRELERAALAMAREMAQAPPYARVELRMAFGVEPRPGTELHTRTGRRYEVLGVRGKTITGLVLPATEPVAKKVLFWEWGPRTKSRLDQQRRCCA